MQLDVICQVLRRRRVSKEEWREENQVLKSDKNRRREELIKLC